ncbi:MAG: hypothetical protein LBM75_05480 [Myxococcales bacterium]|jgi:hypothetical protein|nr:hypothetical protein [Myxococcales bacterium]
MMNKKSLKKIVSGQAMTEYALLVSIFAGWALVIYELMMKQFNAYLQSVYFVLNLTLP